MDNKEYYTQKDLLTRGWTKTLVNKFLPVPHDTKPNYFYRSAAPVKLYKIKVVEQIENSNCFQKDIKKTRKRQNSAKKAIKTKKENLMNKVNSIEFKILFLPRKKLLQKSINHYNERQYELGKDNIIVDNNCDQNFLERIQVNYIRHVLTTYDNKLHDIFAKVGTDEAYIKIRNKIYKEIAKVYPYLKVECKRQNI